MKRYRGKNRLATMEKEAWQKRFLKAQDAILSRYAYRAYKELGPGLIAIELSNCMDLIIPGLNLPNLNYSCELTLDLNHPNSTYWLEKIKAYDPERQYLVGLRSYQANPPFIKCWVRDLKLLSTEDFEREYALGLGMIAVATSDEPIDRYEKHGVVLKKLKFDDPKVH